MEVNRKDKFQTFDKNNRPLAYVWKISKRINDAQYSVTLITRYRCYIITIFNKFCLLKDTNPELRNLCGIDLDLGSRG